MRWMTLAIALNLTVSLIAADAPLAERYLHSGQLAEGKKALEAALVNDKDDDQARFGLGAVKLVAAVERLGQSLYRYGAKPESADVPILRLPVPENEKPQPIDYAIFRGILDAFRNDLIAVDATLASVKDDNVKLPLRLAGIHLNLDGDGKPTDEFMDILEKIVGRQPLMFLDTNPEFLVSFDRGDVAWLRAYCHVLAGMVDLYLAFDTEKQFDLWSETVFANPKNRLQGDDAEKRRKRNEAWEAIAVKEPKRVGQFRRHILSLAELNRETWKHIRTETDDDNEWLPNPKQTGVLGLPVRDEMIDAWLAMMDELQALFDGERTFLKVFIKKDEKGLNLKPLLDEPPDNFVLDRGFPMNLPDKYWSDDEDVRLNVIFAVMNVFSEPMAVGYAAWFN